MDVKCKDCGRVRRGVLVATFVCRFCLGLFGVRVRPKKGG